MEKFDLEAFMRSLDDAGFNKLVMVNIHALEITQQELEAMIDQARELYQDENPGEEVEILVHHNHSDSDSDSGTFYIAVIHENEMDCFV